MPIQPALSLTTWKVRRLCDGASAAVSFHYSQPPMMWKSLAAQYYYSDLFATLAVVADDDVHDVVQVRQSNFQQRVGASSDATAVLLIAVHHVL